MTVFAWWFVDAGVRGQRTNDHDEDPPREAKVVDDPDKEEQEAHDGKHPQVQLKLAAQETIKKR